MREVMFIITFLTIAILITIVIISGATYILTKINISMGPYECIDIDNNIVECEQTWRSHGTLYGITKDGKTIDLKSYKSIKEE